MGVVSVNKILSVENIYNAVSENTGGRARFISQLDKRKKFKIIIHASNYKLLAIDPSFHSGQHLSPADAVLIFGKKNNK